MEWNMIARLVAAMIYKLLKLKLHKRKLILAKNVRPTVNSRGGNGSLQMTNEPREQLNTYHVTDDRHMSNIYFFFFS